ncbi:hypothetical protein FWF48_04385, partial [Candidatus Saccharibacteria bacterium]|nr:hypothetical protein [Candidatus Saccharibacteria bacterium]
SRSDNSTTIGRATIPFFFPGGTYELIDDNSDGTQFKLTASGKKWLRQQLKRDGGYGVSRARGLYGSRAMSIYPRMIKA